MPFHYKSKSKSEGKKSYVWILQPLLFVALLWFSYSNPNYVTNKVPSLLNNLWNSKENSFDTYLPSLPDKPSELVRLGELENLIQTTTNDTVLTTYLNEVKTITKWNKEITKDDVTKLIQWINNSDNHKSVLSKIWGFMSFVNVLFIVGICGMVFFFYPALQVILVPLAELIGDLIVLLWNNKHLLEPFGYVLCYWIIIEGFRYPVDTGMYVSLLGCVGYHGMVFYSTLNHFENVQDDEKTLMYFLMMLGSAPLALHYQSRLYGFLTVGTLYQAMGFIIFCGTLCWLIGFNDEKTAHTVTARSLLLVIAFTIMKLFTPMTLLQPFATPVFVLGTVVYFIGMLITCSKWHVRGQSYINYQLFMIISLLVAMGVGATYNINALFNIGVTFLVLYLGEKASEIVPEKHIVTWLFLISAGLVYISMYLHTHPKFLMDLFDTDAMLR